MQPFLPTVIIRHKKENLKKCSLSGLESRTDCVFFKYPGDTLPSLQGYLILAVDAPELTAQDSNSGLLLIDATWRYSEKMLHFVEQQVHLERRSLPSHFKTAYPRRQDDCADPSRGLASIEALFIAYTILKRPTEGLLDHYYWKEQFLSQNQLTA